MTRAASIAILLLLLACACGDGGDARPSETAAAPAATPDPADLRDGDLIFHRSLSAQAEALERALDSPYTHMGLVFLDDGQPFVHEAVGPVKRTPLAEWIARGRDGAYVIRRLRDADALLTPEATAALRAAVSRHDGAPYDSYFEWSDERIYCSELAWKAYREALGLEIGALARFGDHDLTDPLVVAKLQERFGDEIPAEEPVISPAEMYASELLVTVTERE
jgi:hypothetical protein